MTNRPLFAALISTLKYVAKLINFNKAKLGNSHKIILHLFMKNFYFQDNNSKLSGMGTIKLGL